MATEIKQQEDRIAMEECALASVTGLSISARRTALDIAKAVRWLTCEERQAVEKRVKYLLGA